MKLKPYAHGAMASCDAMIVRRVRAALNVERHQSLGLRMRPVAVASMTQTSSGTLVGGPADAPDIASGEARRDLFTPGESSERLPKKQKTGGA